MSKVGVYICHCGINISSNVNIDEVLNTIKDQHGVSIVRDYSYMCSDPGQGQIKSDVREFGLDRVVVAACSPLMHENTFRKACESVGVNGYCFEMANIRAVFVGS